MNIGIWIILAVIVVIIIICIVYCIYNGNCCKKKSEKEYEPTPTNQQIQKPHDYEPVPINYPPEKPHNSEPPPPPNDNPQESEDYEPPPRNDSPLTIHIELQKPNGYEPPPKEETPQEPHDYEPPPTNYIPEKPYDYESPPTNKDPQKTKDYELPPAINLDSEVYENPALDMTDISATVIANENEPNHEPSEMEQLASNPSDEDPNHHGPMVDILGRSFIRARHGGHEPIENNYRHSKHHGKLGNISYFKLVCLSFL